MTARLNPIATLLACTAVAGLVYTTAFADDHEDEPWDEREWEQMEQAALHAEMMHLHIESYLGMIELAERVTESTSSSATTATLAIMALDEQFDDPDDKAEYLEEELAAVKDIPTRRLIRLKLAEAYREAGDEDEALEHLSVLIRGKDVRPEHLALSESPSPHREVGVQGATKAKPPSCDGGCFVMP